MEVFDEMILRFVVSFMVSIEDWFQSSVLGVLKRKTSYLERKTKIFLAVKYFFFFFWCGKERLDKMIAKGRNI